MPKEGIMHKTTPHQKLKLPLFIVCLFAPLLLAECIKLCAPSAGIILQNLRLPPFFPPGWLLQAMWFILYIIMGYSLYVIITNSILQGRAKNSAFYYFVLQLALNYLWYTAFFAFQYRGFSVLLMALWLSLVIAVWKRVRAINVCMSNLWFFYTAWLFFSAILNYSIWILNL